MKKETCGLYAQQLKHTAVVGHSPSHVCTYKHLKLLTASTVWHWAQRCLNTFAPLAASPSGISPISIATNNKSSNATYIYSTLQIDIQY